MDVFQSILKNIPFKVISITLWESRVDTHKPSKYAIPEIYDALYKLFSDLEHDVLTSEANHNNLNSLYLI